MRYSRVRYIEVLLSVYDLGAFYFRRFFKIPFQVCALLGNWSPAFRDMNDVNRTLSKSEVDFGRMREAELPTSGGAYNHHHHHHYHHVDYTRMIQVHCQKRTRTSGSAETTGPEATAIGTDVTSLQATTTSSSEPGTRRPSVNTSCEILCSVNKTRSSSRQEELESWNKNGADHRAMIPEVVILPEVGSELTRDDRRDKENDGSNRCSPSSADERPYPTGSHRDPICYLL